jgi:hypothetical protein
VKHGVWDAAWVLALVLGVEVPLSCDQDKCGAPATWRIYDADDFSHTLAFTCGQDLGPAVRWYQEYAPISIVWEQLPGAAHD